MGWNATLIAQDKTILDEYGLRRKREIWAAKAMVSGFRRRARELNAVKNKQLENILLEKVNKLGLIKANTLDDILSLDIKNVLDRRLQTIVFRKGITATMKQARQMIAHGHVTIDGRKTKFPSYIVPLSEEDKVGLNIELKKPPVQEKQQKVAEDNNAEETDNAAHLENQ